MLADEMGLGKTAQAIAALEYMRQNECQRGPFLVVAPLSTLSVSETAQSRPNPPEYSRHHWP